MAEFPWQSDIHDDVGVHFLVRAFVRRSTFVSQDCGENVSYFATQLLLQTRSTCTIYFQKKTMAKQQLSWQLNKQRIASWYKSLITGLKNGLPDQLNKSLSSVCYILHYFLHWYNVGIVKLKKQKNTNFVWNP